MNHRRIIAVDFDGTLFTESWPMVGDPIWPVIEKVKEEQAKGSAIILWTCRSGASLIRAVDACLRVGINPDAVNENLPELVEAWGGEDTRKIFASEYWDDRAGRMTDVPDTNVSNKWISVEERLPDEEGWYITKTNATGKTRGVLAQKYEITTVRGKEVRRWMWLGHISPWNVTHWMPLPEPPEVDT